jgi:hypothetical protein
MLSNPAPGTLTQGISFISEDAYCRLHTVASSLRFLSNLGLDAADSAMKAKDQGYATVNFLDFSNMMGILATQISDINSITPDAAAQSLRQMGL